jgi:hypothetical protein
MAGWVSVLSLLASLGLAASLSFSQSLVWQSPGPSRSEAAALLRAVCPGDLQASRGGSTSFPGCRPCPKYTTDGGSSPPMARRESFDLRTVIYGSFTTAGTEEAVASFQGCEPHASGYGGSILLRELNGSWAMVDYTPALITTACQTYHLNTGRDLLICEGEDHHMAAESQGILACDFSREKAARCGEVFGVVDTRVACGNTAVWGSIDKAALRDLNDDGMPDLILWISVGQGTFPQPGGSCNPNPSHAPVQRRRLDFLFQQDKNMFLPAPWSKALTEHYRAVFHEALQKALKALNPASTP